MKQEIIAKIKKLSEEGKTQKEISEVLKIPRGTIQYWLSDSTRKIRSQKGVEYFRNLPKEKKSQIYKRRSKYISSWICKKYHSNEKFKKKVNENRKKYYKKVIGQDMKGD